MNTDVEDLLREGMERYTADLLAPAGLTERATRRRPRPGLRALTAGAAALAAGAAAMALVVVPRLDGAGVSAVDAAYVVKNVSNALSAAAPGRIAQMTITTSGGPGGVTSAEEWSNGDEWRSVLYSSPGHPIYDEGYSTATGYTLVSYLTKTWTRQPGVGRPAGSTIGAPAIKNGCGPAIGGFPVLFRLGLPATSTSASSLPATVATTLRTAVSCGSLSVAGHQTVDGTNAIELKSRPDSPISETIWVDPGTYLPVRAVVGSGYGPALRQTADFTWLPPTAQNLAKLTVPVPAGFRQVSLPAAVTPNLKLIPAAALPRPTAFCPAATGMPCQVRAPRLVPSKARLRVPAPTGSA